MRTSGDVLRSFKKYVGELVLPDFEVRLSSEEGTWERPFCRVAWTTPTSVNHIGARQTECRRTLQIVCWPVEAETPDDARLAAEDLNEKLFVGFAQGLHQASWNTATGRAHPLRVPIYDYATKTAQQAAAGVDRAATDFARIPEPPDIGDIEDPNTDVSRLSIADIRVVWTRSVAVPIAGETVAAGGLIVGPTPTSP